MKKVISFHYRLTDTQGKEMDSSIGHKPLSFIVGAGQIVPGLESELITMKPSQKKTVKVPAAGAYGQHHPEMIIQVPRAKLPKPDLAIGDRFRGGPENDAPVFRVTKLTQDEAMLDANHPLAGQDLTFDVEIIEIREATEEELAHGHVHDGDHHH